MHANLIIILIVISNFAFFKWGEKVGYRKLYEKLNENARKSLLDLC